MALVGPSLKINNIASLFLKQDSGEEVVAIFGGKLLPVEPPLSHPQRQATSEPAVLGVMRPERANLPV